MDLIEASDQLHKAVVKSNRFYNEMSSIKGGNWKMLYQVTRWDWTDGFQFKLSFSTFHPRSTNVSYVREDFCHAIL